MIEEVLQVRLDRVAAQKSVDELAVLGDSCFLILEDSFLDLVLGSQVLLIEQLLHPIQLLLKLAVVLRGFPDQLGEHRDLGVVHFDDIGLVDGLVLDVGLGDVDVLALGVDVVVAVLFDALLLDLDGGVRFDGCDVRRGDIALKGVRRSERRLGGVGHLGRPREHLIGPSRLRTVRSWT